MKYSIIIPTYNHCDDLLKPCIESIIRNTDLSKDIEVLVIANGCTDGTREYVESLGAPFKLYWFDKPMGYTITTNFGIKEAKGEYIIPFSNDVLLLDWQQKNEWLDRMTQPFLENPKMGLTGPLTLYDDDAETDFLVFCLVMTKRSIIDEIGALDEIYSPGFGEDIDFCMRLKQRGYEFVEIGGCYDENGRRSSDFPCWHLSTQTFKDIPEYASTIVKRNQATLRQKYGTNKLKYSIVIPTYNHCEDLLKPCIESILKYTDMTDVELVISANGCTDGTKWYLESLKHQFASLGFEKHFKYCWSDEPLGYAKATNAGIRLSTADKIVLLNNDAVLLEQEKNRWLKLFDAQFDKDINCGISCIIKGHSEPAGRDFAVFFCVMIHRKVFRKIGLLNEVYGIGGGEDTEFCIEAEIEGYTVREVLEKTWSDGAMMYTGNFPIWHQGEVTMHDPNCVSDYDKVFFQNSLILAKKYNPEHYKFLLCNNYERAVFLKNDKVFDREASRYQWAAEHLLGNKVLEIGCSTGYGVQFLPESIDYTGLDYDETIIKVAQGEQWRPNLKFVNADINTYELGQYDTIIAFEIIEHLDNGLEIAQMLKKHCKRLLISVPYMEPPGFWGEHHRLHMLNQSHLPEFEYTFCDEWGGMHKEPNKNSQFNLMLCEYNA